MSTQRVDCSRYSQDNYKPECEKRAEAGLGAVVLIAAVAIVAAALWLRHLRKKYAAAGGRSAVPLPDRPRADGAHQAAERRRLREEYVEKLQAGDPHALEAARDYGDNDHVQWRAQVLGGLFAVSAIALVVLVGLLILFFTWMKHLAGS